MNDTKPQLVLGELTGSGAITDLACEIPGVRARQTRFDSLDWPPGIPVGLVTSWCRVLVLPDTSETRLAVDSVIEHHFGWLAPDPEVDVTGAVLAALRKTAVNVALTSDVSGG